jgi:hypothetical protein
MELSADLLQQQIPYYLTQAAKDNLVKALKDFPSIDYYINAYKAETLQGDGWTELGLIRFETAERKQVRGIILSNSCDIDPKNKRDLPANVVFAPIIKLKSFESLLTQANISAEQIKSKFSSIRNQMVTTLFYLPKGSGLDDEYIALLDDIHSVPYKFFYDQNKRAKLFTLSQEGFYLFILKLSIHFCRFHEGLIREEVPEGKFKQLIKLVPSWLRKSVKK